jgi:F0F1-type ATP synthase assembly protein I
VSEPRTSDSTSSQNVAEVRLRRAPRLPVFLLAGAIVGAIVTLIVTSLSDADPKVGFAASYGYFCLYGVPAGVVLGAVIGLVLDRRSVRRARTVTAELERVETPDVTDTPEG